MASSNWRAHDDLTLAWDLILIVALLTTTVQKLHGLLLALVCVDHAFVASDTANDTRLLTAAMLSQTVFTTKICGW